MFFQALVNLSPDWGVEGAMIATRASVLMDFVVWMK